MVYGLQKAWLKRLKEYNIQKAFQIYLYYPSNGYHRVAIELKARNIFKKDGTLLKSQHTAQQQKIIDLLNANNYYATFAVGYNDAKNIIDNYVNVK